MNAIVLAGGLSSRMGTDKSLLSFDGLSLAGRIMERFRPYVEDVILVVADPRSHTGSAATVVADVLPGCGPLGGLYTGLLHSHADLNAVVACDMPFANPALAIRLAARAGGFDAVVPVSRGRWEPLHAIYNRSCLPVAKALLGAGGAPGLMDLLKRVPVHAVALEELDPGGQLATALLNVNTPGDLDEARHLARELQERFGEAPGKAVDITDIA